MENYILSLIKENNRVIVPNFGAFIVAKENGFSVLFNNFLSFNDGLLVEYIVKKEHVTNEEAENKINEFVEKLKSTLDEKGTYVIEKLGTFTKDATGILRFEQVAGIGEANSETEAKATKPADESLLDIDNSEAAPVKELDETEPIISNTTLNDSTPIAEFEEGPASVDEAPVKTIHSPVFESKLDDKKEEKKKEDDPVVVANKYLEEDNTKRNRSIVFFLSFFILLPLIGFTIYFFFFKDNSPKETEKKIAKEIKKTEPIPAAVEPVSGTIDAGPAIEENEKEKEEVVEEKPATVQVKANKPHQLIVGSFSSEVNANKKVKVLNGKGYEHAFVFMHNNRFLVSLESFAKVYEAQARQEEILQNDRMESWIMTKRN